MRRTPLTMKVQKLPLPSEEDEQKAYFDWVRIMRNRDKRFCMIYHIPNGSRTKREYYTTQSGERKSYSPEGVRLELMGVLEGVLDIAIDVPCRGYHGMKLEMKKQNYSYNSDVSKAQKEMIVALTDSGYYASIGGGCAEAVRKTCWYFDIPVPNEFRDRTLNTNTKLTTKG